MGGSDLVGIDNFAVLSSAMGGYVNKVGVCTNSQDRVRCFRKGNH